MDNISQQLKEKVAELERQKETIRQQEQFLNTIRQQEQCLRSIVDNVREAIFAVDVERDGTFRYRSFNRAAQELTGIEDVVNKTPSDILPHEAAEMVERRYEECLESKATIAYEECLPFKGEESWWLTNLNPLIDKTGEIYRIIGTSLNITDRKRAAIKLNRDKKFLETLLDNYSDGIVACDRDGILTLFNRATKDFHGIPQEAISASEWAEYYDLYLPDGKTIMPKDEIPLFRALKGESLRNVEMMIIPQHGEPLALLASGDPIIDSRGENIGAIVVMRDITKQKQAEQALTKLNDELEARVEKRTTQLGQVNNLLSGAVEQLRKSNQELEQFANVISHDLKAPLRAISNLSEWIEEDLENKLEGDTKHNLNLLRSRVYRMENLIDGLLAYSRIGRLKSQPQEVAVGRMLAEIIDSLDIPANYNIEIQGEIPTFVTEAAPLRQVFSNLIGNAVKYCNRENGRIVISAREEDNFHEFTVTDNGKGIDAKNYDRIFDIFQTLESKDSQESTGIGLSIVKKAVENQGGQIIVESQLDEGSAFHFTWKK